MEVKVKIPYIRDIDLELGDLFDFVTLKKQRSNDHVTPTYEARPPNVTTHSFSFANSLSDVCKILDLSLEYALKVKIGTIEDPTVFACLENIGVDNGFTLIFRQCFLHQKKYLATDDTAMPRASGTQNGMSCNVYTVPQPRIVYRISHISNILDRSLMTG